MYLKQHAFTWARTSKIEQMNGCWYSPWPNNIGESEMRLHWVWRKSVCWQWGKGDGARHNLIDLLSFRVLTHHGTNMGHIASVNWKQCRSTAVTLTLVEWQRPHQKPSVDHPQFLAPTLILERRIVHSQWPKHLFIEVCGIQTSHSTSDFVENTTQGWWR